MTLSLRVVNMEHLPNGGPTEVRLERHGLIIGRSQSSDWHLPDPRSFISSTHCEIDYRDGGYWLIDRSKNGTFMSGSGERLGDRAHRIETGDRFHIGHYEIEARAASSAPPASGGFGAGVQGGPGGLGPAPDWGGWGGSAAPAAPMASPDRWDAPAPQPVISGQGPMNQNWAPPSVSPPPPPQQGFDAWSPPPPPPPPVSGWSSAPDPYAQAQDAPARDVWGELEGSAAVDWAAGGFGRRAEPERAAWDQPAQQPAAPSDPFGLGGPAAADPFGLGAPGGGQPSRPPADPFAPAPQTAPPGQPGGFAAPPQRPAYGAPPGQDPFGYPSAPAPAPAAPQQAAPPSYPPQAPAYQPQPPAGPGAYAGAGLPPPEPARPAPAPPPHGGVGGVGGAQVFFAGAGINPAGLRAPPEAVLETAGALLRRLVAGLSIMLEARARAKAQLGAQNTMFEFRGNNPLKFARTPEQALLQLVNPPERGFMEPERAIEDAFKDLQAHQMATLSAMQGALRATLSRFSPQAIRSRAEQRGILAKILPNAREAAMWQAYEKEFEGVARGSDEAFMDVFAKEFKSAYEKAARANAKQQPE